jgi:hypothetical protein
LADLRRHELEKISIAVVEIHAGTAANHHAVPTGAGASAPDVRQGALGGRRAGLDVVT